MFYSNGAYSLFKVDTPVISGGATPPSFQDIYSYQFDGVDDYLDMSNPSNLNFDADNPFSISVWFKRPSDTNAFAIVSKSLGFPDVNGYMLFVYNNQVYFRIRRSASLFHQIISNSTHPFNTWVHYVVTYDGLRSGSGQGLNLYQDGIKLTNVQKSGNFATGSAQTSANFSVGSRESTLDLFFNGNIDEVSVFNSELSESDVTSIYNGGVPNNLNELSTPPLSWWRMGESANWDGSNWTLTDQGSGGNDATSQNMAEASRVLDVPPNPWTNTKSILLDGVDDYVNIGTSSLGITSAISVSAWVKIPTTNTGGGGTNIQVIACEDTTSGGQRNWNMFWRGMGSNYFAWVIHHTNLSISSVTTTGITPNDGQWHHILATYDGTTNANGIKLYVDGVLNVQGTAGSTGLNAFSSTESTIGATTGGGAWRFEGNIDEVAVWNSDRNADASTIYNGGVPNNLNDLSNPPLSWWRFEGSGTTAIDSGGGNNDGTLINGVTRSTNVPT
jgi:hypothetical protein